MLISVADALTQLPHLEAGDEDATLLIEGLIADVDGIFARRTGRPPATLGATPTMESTTYTLDLRGNGSRDLDLKVYPVTAVASAKIDTTLDWDGSEETVSSSDYFVYEGRSLRLKSTASSAWSRVEDANRVTFTAGYATTPDDLKRLAAQAVRFLWDARANQGQASVTQAGTTTQLQDVARGMGDRDFLPDFILAGLGAFRLPWTVA